MTLVKNKADRIAEIAAINKNEVASQLREVFPEEKALTFWKLQSFVGCYNLIKENLKRILDFPYGEFDINECSEFILDNYTQKLLGEMLCDKKKNLPFGDLEDWLALVEGLVRLSAGIPATYIEAYNKLTQCKEKALRK